MVLSLVLTICDNTFSFSRGPEVRKSGFPTLNDVPYGLDGLPRTVRPCQDTGVLLTRLVLLPGLLYNFDTDTPFSSLEVLGGDGGIRAQLVSYTI